MNKLKIAESINEIEEALDTNIGTDFVSHAEDILDYNGNKIDKIYYKGEEVVDRLSNYQIGSPIISID